MLVVPHWILPDLCLFDQSNQTLFLLQQGSPVSTTRPAPWIVEFATVKWKSNRWRSIRWMNFCTSSLAELHPVHLVLFVLLLRRRRLAIRSVWDLAGIELAGPRATFRVTRYYIALGVNRFELFTSTWRPPRPKSNFWTFETYSIFHPTNLTTNLALTLK